MRILYSAGTEIVVRYLCAIGIGLLFELIAGRFINHLSMYGTTMFPTLALAMIVAIPVWHLSAKLLSKRISTYAAEITTAISIAAISIQPIYLPLYYSNIMLPTGTETSKAEMMTWYMATTSNITMATLTALLYICISHITTRWKGK